MELVALVAVCAVTVGALIFALLILPTEKPFRRLLQVLKIIFGGKK